MSRRSDRFNRSMWHTVISEQAADCKREAERLLAAADWDEARELRAWHDELGRRNANAAGAVLRLVWGGKPHLARVLNLILENGEDRELSVQKVKKSTYFRARNELLDFFVGL